MWERIMQNLNICVANNELYDNFFMKVSSFSNLNLSSVLYLITIINRELLRECIVIQILFIQGKWSFNS